MKLLLLPGMDGTGHLFAPLCNELPNEWSWQIVSYPNEGPQDYPRLTAHVLEILPRDEDFVLLAESFSGPIAYRIALQGNPRLQGIIFVATFLQPPRPFLLFLLSRVMGIIGWIRPPGFILRRYFLGDGASQELLDLFWTTVRQVPRSVIAARMKSVLGLRPPVGSLNIPCVYIQATDDRFVPAGCVELFRRCIPQVSVCRVEGPHFVLQAHVIPSVISLRSLTPPL
jgi:pimeloyl-ACP methyl ester carboxylesterase